MQVVLLSGFQDDEVRVSVDGRSVFAETVTTNTKIGVARALETADHPGPVLVDVQVPNRGLATSVQIAPGQRRVEISLQDGTLRVLGLAEQDYGHA